MLVLFLIIAVILTIGIPVGISFLILRFLKKETMTKG
jgi:hypothetical protein